MMEENLDGWQKQPTKLNIQGEIERAIFDLTGEEVDLIASGRTDSRSSCPWTSCKF
jgi:tRNA pseudouridine38-40 synthase